MPISIDSGAMDEAKAKLASMASKDRWLGELAMRVSAGGMKLVADEFKTSTDPYGTPWAPLARPRTRDKRAARRAIAKGKKPRGPQVLVNTGRMRGSAGASPNGQEARVVVPTWYARFHQDGSVRMPQRMILPREGDLPARWEEMVGRESKTFMAQRFGVEA
jgi:phage gpG-like protein